MRKFFIAAALLGSTIAANAQSNASAAASQEVNLNLSNALEITFTGNNSATGSTVSMPFTTVNDFVNGVESSAQEMRVRSNKNFMITVKSASATFSLNNGISSILSLLPVSSLGVVVSANNTGGTLGTGISSTLFKALSIVSSNLIVGGEKGGNQTFSVKYRATPGFTFSAGTYTADVVFTATQL